MPVKCPECLSTFVFKSKNKENEFICRACGNVFTKKIDTSESLEGNESELINKEKNNNLHYLYFIPSTFDTKNISINLSIKDKADINRKDKNDNTNEENIFFKLTKYIFDKSLEKESISLKLLSIILFIFILLIPITIIVFELSLFISIITNVNLFEYFPIPDTLLEMINEYIKSNKDIISSMGKDISSFLGSLFFIFIFHIIFLGILLVIIFITMISVYLVIFKLIFFLLEKNFLIFIVVLYSIFIINIIIAYIFYKISNKRPLLKSFLLEFLGVILIELVIVFAPLVISLIPFTFGDGRGNSSHSDSWSGGDGGCGDSGCGDGGDGGA